MYKLKSRFGFVRNIEYTCDNYVWLDTPIIVDA